MKETMRTKRGKNEAGVRLYQKNEKQEDTKTLYSKAWVDTTDISEGTVSRETICLYFWLVCTINTIKYIFYREFFFKSPSLGWAVYCLTLTLQKGKLCL